MLFLCFNLLLSLNKFSAVFNISTLSHIVSRQKKIQQENNDIFVAAFVQVCDVWFGKESA